ncbi:thymidylate synthase [Vibrio cholerae]|nr:thymidylate synthase [Vibrio cholerae]EKF6136271.1 thymidylate synthase [Vibrio cholerae]EMC4026383.1 thymidylate synthase [Vibrio cholerae]
MRQYLDLCQRIVDQGVWVENERTGKRCLTVINADLTYDVGNNQFPLVTTRKSFWKAAVAELLGYIRGYDNAADFRQLGTKTWDANANLNQAWLNNPYRKGEDDMGRVYGVFAFFPMLSILFYKTEIIGHCGANGAAIKTDNCP